MKSANDLTQGVIWKQLVKYSLPLIATSVMQSLYSLFDILIAGDFLEVRAYRELTTVRRCWEL